MAFSDFQPIRGGFGDILLAIRQRIVDKAGLPSRRVKIICRNQVPQFVAPRSVWVRPGSFVAEQEEVRGAGRVNTPLVRRVEVIIQNRAQIDSSDSDQFWYTNDDRGFVALEEAVMNALHIYDPEDSDQNVLLKEPMRIVGMDMPQMNAQDPGWGEGTIIYEVKYLPPLDQADQ